MVTRSKVNGNIVVDGKDITVYTPKSKWEAKNIIQDSDHQFVTNKQVYNFTFKSGLSSNLKGLGVIDVYSRIGTDTEIDNLRKRLVDVMVKLDTRIKTLENQLKVLRETTIPNIESELSSLSSSIDTLSNSVEDLDSRVKALEEA